MAENDGEDRRRFAVGLWLRVCVGSVALCFFGALSLLGAGFDFADCAPAYLGLAAAVGVNAVYWLAGSRRGFPLRDFYVHWGGDLVLITVILYGLGGSALPSSITPYMLIVTTSAVFVSRRASYAVATGAVLSHSTLVLLETAGALEPAWKIAAPMTEGGVRAFVIGAPVVMIYLVAYVAGVSADQVATANRVLRLQNQELDRLHRELDFNTKILAHDIRSPVTAVGGAIGELRRELERRGAGEDEMSLVEIARANVDHIEDMIDALQEVHRGGLEHSEPGEDTDLAGVLDEVAVELRAEISRKRVALDAGDLPTVHGVRRRLAFALRNLLTNALRYVPGDGRGQVTVGAEDRGSEWRVYVRDNGPGIAPEHREMIFEWFTKAPSPSKSPGLGIGLALVRRTAEQHGGRAWVDSDGRSGATFWLAIPKRVRREAEASG